MLKPLIRMGVYLGTLHPFANVEVWVKGACARSKRLSKSSPCSTGSSITICLLLYMNLLNNIYSFLIK